VKSKILWFLFLGVMTVWSAFFVDRFQNNGPEVLSENWQILNSVTGTAKHGQNLFYLSSSDVNRSIAFNQNIKLKLNSHYLKLEGYIKCLEVIPGRQKWNSARLLLLQYNHKGERLQTPHEVISISGSRDWKYYGESFVLSPDTSELKVMIKLSNCTGSMWVKNLSLVPVVKTQIYMWTKRVLFSFWWLFFFFLFGLQIALINKAYPQGILLFFIIIIIVLLATMPGEISIQIKSKIIHQIQIYGYVYKKFFPVDIRGAGHFCLFILLGAAFSFSMLQKQVFPIIAKILLFAGGTELMQLHVDQRTPQFMDFFYDISGGVIGILLFRFFCAKIMINKTLG
jgi:hypothetical protein